MKKDGFTVCANNCMNCLYREERYATAHVYENALRSFAISCGTECVSFNLIIRESLKRYSSYLIPYRSKLNTISTYMRILRCIYNEGVDTHQAPYVHRLFRDIFIGVDTRRKKAILMSELHTLLYGDPQSEKPRRTQAIANLLSLSYGVSFADLAHLEKSNLEGDILKHSRIKTGILMGIEILESASCIVSRLRNTHSVVLPEHLDYLFYILNGKSKRNEEAAYRGYQSTLRRFNNDLRNSAKKLYIHSSVAFYTSRHSRATTAKYRGVPIEMISELLGHKPIGATQVYLKGFGLNECTKVNRLDYPYARNYRGIPRKVY